MYELGYWKFDSGEWHHQTKILPDDEERRIIDGDYYGSEIIKIILPKGTDMDSVTIKECNAD